MKSGRTVGMTLLGVWLLLTGLSPFLNVSIPSRTTVLAALALAAGVLILLDK